MADDRRLESPLRNHHSLVRGWRNLGHQGASGEQPYRQVSGGKIKGCLYLADHVQPGKPLVLTEGEFDALVAWQVGEGKFSAASIGSASNRRINPRWCGKLLTMPRLLACMDADSAGAKASAEIAAISSAVRVAQVPIGKDLNEFYLRAGRKVVYEWLVENL
jgi:DNA primase